jgi:release factor glutamine methyltransferase
MGGLATAPVGEALAAATEALRAAGVSTPRLDAELLLAEASGLGRERLAAEPDVPLPAGAGRELAGYLRRRLRREPIAYILGRQGFRSIELAVDGRVLIPRPETELLVEVALELAPGVALDVGTGSGAIALALAEELDRVEAWGSDTSPAALAVARENAARLGHGARVRFVEGTIPGDPGRFDLLLANLPYVAASEWAGLEPEITRYEPRRALLGEVALWPRPPLAVALEVGAGQAPTVAELMRRAGYERVEARRDLAGTERVVLGR